MKGVVGIVAVGIAVAGLSGCSSQATEAESTAASTAAPSSAAAASAAPSSAASAAASDAAVQAAPAGLIDPSKLTVCAYVAFPPLEFKEAGSDVPTGFDVEAAQAVAAGWGINAEIVDIGFDGLLPALDAKRCDVVWSGMFLNEERQQKADASPYLKTGNALLVAKGNPAGITSVDDLAGKRLAVAAGTTAVDVAEKLSSDLVAKGLEPIEIQKYPTFPAEVGAVKSGKADAVLEVDVALADAVRTAPDAFELVPSVFPIDGSLAVYSSKDSGVAAAVTQAWQNLIADGTAAALAEKYGIPVENLTAD